MFQILIFRNMVVNPEYFNRYRGISLCNSSGVELPWEVETVLQEHFCLVLREQLWIVSKLSKLMQGFLLAVSFCLKILVCYHKSHKPNYCHFWLSPSFKYSYNSEVFHKVILSSLLVSGKTFLQFFLYPLQAMSGWAFLVLCWFDFSQ